MVQVIPRAVAADGGSPTASGRGRRLTPTQLHAQRVAWGKMAGAKVAAAYKELTERA